MALWTNVDEAAGKPKNLTAAEKALTFGVDAGEMAGNRAAGVDGLKPAHAGWTRVVEGTGGRAGRWQTEVLVAMGSMTGDAEDAVFADYSIRIRTQPSASSVATGGAASFAVVAATTPAGNLITYQWKVSTDSGSTFANVTDAGVYSGATTATLSISDNTGLNGNLYACTLTGDAGLIATVVSNNALLTEV